MVTAQTPESGGFHDGCFLNSARFESQNFRILKYLAGNKSSSSYGTRISVGIQQITTCIRCVFVYMICIFMCDMYIYIFHHIKFLYLLFLYIIYIYVYQIVDCPALGVRHLGLPVCVVTSL